MNNLSAIEIEEIEELIKKIKQQLKDDYYVKKLFEQKILDLKNPRLSYFFAKEISCADIMAHGKVVIESKDPEWNYRFAQAIKGADVLAHGKVIIESKDPYWNYHFTKDIKGADVKAHGQVIIESGDPQLNYYFAKNVEGADVEAHMAIFNNQLLTDANIKRLNKLLKQ